MAHKAEPQPEFFAAIEGDDLGLGVFSAPAELLTLEISVARTQLALFTISWSMATVQNLMLEEFLNIEWGWFAVLSREFRRVSKSFDYDYALICPDPDWTTLDSLNLYLWWLVPKLDIICCKCMSSITCLSVGTSPPWKSLPHSSSAQTDAAQAGHGPVEKWGFIWSMVQSKLLHDW